MLSKTNVPSQGFPGKTEARAISISNEDNHGGQLFVKLEITGSETLATPITFDGGSLNLVKVFLSPLPNYITGSHVDFALTPSSASFRSVGKPLERTGSATFLEYTTGDRLVFGPRSSFLSNYYEENSSSPKVFGDTLLHVRAVGPSEIDVEYTTAIPFNTASFTIRTANNIDIESIDSTLYLPSQTGYTASISSSGFTEDGLTLVTINGPEHCGEHITGHGTLCRLKTTRQLFDYELLQSGKELVSPPIGADGDLIIPNIDKSEVFPVTKNLIFHVDPSTETYVSTQISSSVLNLANLSKRGELVVKEIANPYGVTNLATQASGNMPMWTNNSSSFEGSTKYLEFGNETGGQVLTSSLPISDLDSHDLKKLTFFAVFKLDNGTAGQEFERTIFAASSSHSSFEVRVVGATNPGHTGGAFGTVRIITSGSNGDMKGSNNQDQRYEINYDFGSSARAAAAHLISITTDGAVVNPRGTQVRDNGAEATASYSSMGNLGTSKVHYSLGGSGSFVVDEMKAKSFQGDIGEVLLYNTILTSNEIEAIEGYLGHKWGLTGSFNANHPHRFIKPTVANAVINNIASKFALQKSDDYFVGSGSASDRASALATSKLVGVSEVTIASGGFDGDSKTLINPDYDVLRELPAEVSITASQQSDTEVFVKSYDKNTGILELGYKAEKKVDGYWLELGNTFSGSGGLTSKQVGIIGLDPKDKNSQCVEKGWSQHIGYGKNAQDIFNKDPLKKRVLKQIAFGFSQGRIGKTKGKDKDDYRLSGSWYLPETPRGEDQVLTKLKVDPSSFKGIPTIASWRLVTTKDSKAAAGTWKGNSGSSTTGTANGTLITREDLNEVIKLAQLGFAQTGSNIPEIAMQSTRFDASGSGEYIDIVDVLAVYNHMVDRGEGTERASFAQVLAQDIETIKIKPPGTPSVTAAAVSPESGSAVDISWTLASLGGDESGIQIWRRGSSDNQKKNKRSNLFLFTGNREKLFDKTVQSYELIKVFSGSGHVSYTDKQAPYNENCCENEDNPKIDYIVVAFNEGGESPGASGIVQLVCRNEVPVANNVSLTSSINTPITFTMGVTDNNAPPPFGTASADVDDVDTLTFKISDYANGKLNQLTNNDGIFTFSPNKDFIGKTTIEYEVTNKAGCSSQAQVRIEVSPAKFGIKTKLTKPLRRTNKPVDIPIEWNREDIRGKILKYEVYRALSGSTYSATPLKTISGKLPVSEQFVKFKDKITPEFGHGASEVKYKYKIKAFGFQGDAEKAISENRIVTVETNDHHITIPAKSTGSFPSVTLSSSNASDAYHPRVQLSWDNVTGSVGGALSSATREAQYYNIYRQIISGHKYKKIATVRNRGKDTYIYIDKDLPKPSGRYHGNVDYTAKYRITAITDDGENGDPNNSWGGETDEAGIKAASNTPIARNVSFKICRGEALSGSLQNFVHNHIPESSSFSGAAHVLDDLHFSADGNFNFNTAGQSEGNYQFDYSVTSGNKTSADATVTITVIGCDDLDLPDGTEKQHIAGGAYEVQEQFTKKAGVDQVPFSLREPGGRTLRQRSKPYSVSTGKIDTSDD